MEHVDPPSHGAALGSPEAVELRADLARHLAGAIFPAARDSLIEDAERRHAPDGVVRLLQRLPQNRPFDNVERVWEALGVLWERRS